MDDRQLNDHQNQDESLVDALARLLSASHADTLSDADVAWLNETLEQNERAREVYLRMAQDTLALRVWASAELNRDSLQIPPLDHTEHTALSGTENVPVPPDVANLHSSIAGDSSLLWRWSLPGLSGLVVVLGIFVGYLLLRPAGVPSEDSTTPVAETALNQGSLHLNSGSAKLFLPKIGYVILDGPAEFAMLNPMRASLTKGRIRVRVTEESGHGFTVETPYGEVTDLGTEFGLDLTEQGKAGLVVFEGAVNLRVGDANVTDVPKVRQFVGGEAVSFQKGEGVDRIESILTDKEGSFRQTVSQSPDGEIKPTIVKVRDSKAKGETNKFYEIVVGGLQEDSLAYVDRPHQWNGLTKEGMPAYLIGADYVKTFNDHRMRRNYKIQVTIARPAKLYVFFDDRSELPDWLRKDFRNTGDKIGLDGGTWGDSRRHSKRKVEVGPGVSVENSFSIWERTVAKPGTITLMLDNEDLKKGEAIKHRMYGIAAVPLEIQQDQ